MRFDYARLNELWYGDGGEEPELYGMRRIRAEHPLHPETQGWWAIGQGIGYGASFVNQAADLLEQWPDGAGRRTSRRASRCRRDARRSSGPRPSGGGWRSTRSATGASARARRLPAGSPRAVNSGQRLTRACVPAHEDFCMPEPGEPAFTGRRAAECPVVRPRARAATATAGAHRASICSRSAPPPRAPRTSACARRPSARHRHFESSARPRSRTRARPGAHR